MSSHNRERAGDRQSGEKHHQALAVSSVEEDPGTLLRERRNIRALYRHTAWQGAIAAVITTFLPIFAVRAGASPLQVGLLTSLPALVVITLTIPAAAFVARRRNLVRLVSATMLGVWLCSVAITMLPSIFSGQAAERVPVAIIALSCLAAAFSAASSPAWTAVLADAVSRRRRPIVNGQRWALVSVVGAASTFVGGWYLDAVPFPTNYQTLIIGATLAGLASLYYLELIQMSPGSHEVATHLPPSPWQSLVSVPSMVRGQPAFLRYVVSTFVCRLSIALPAALYPLFWVNELHASDRWIGVRAMAGQVTLVVAYAVWGRLTGRMGHQTVLLACGVGIALYPALTGVVPSPVWLVPVAVIWGFFAGGLDIALFEGLVDAIPADQRVAFAAINTTFANLSVLIAPLLGIALVEVIGTRATFLVAGGVGLLGAWLAYVLVGARARATSSIELQPEQS